MQVPHVQFFPHGAVCSNVWLPHVLNTVALVTYVYINQNSFILTYGGPSRLPGIRYRHMADLLQLKRKNKLEKRYQVVSDICQSTQKASSLLSNLC